MYSILEVEDAVEIQQKLRFTETSFLFSIRNLHCLEKELLKKSLKNVLASNSGSREFSGMNMIFYASENELSKRNDQHLDVIGK